MAPARQTPRFSTSNLRSDVSGTIAQSLSFPQIEVSAKAMELVVRDCGKRLDTEVCRSAARGFRDWIRAVVGAVAPNSGDCARDGWDVQVTPASQESETGGPVGKNTRLKLGESLETDAVSKASYRRRGNRPAGSRADDAPPPAAIRRRPKTHRTGSRHHPRNHLGAARSIRRGHAFRRRHRPRLHVHPAHRRCG